MAGDTVASYSVARLLCRWVAWRADRVTPTPEVSNRQLGATELEVHSLLDGRRLARHERGRPARVLPDPVEDSVSLAQVLSALPDPEVHRRSLDRYQEAIDG